MPKETESGQDTEGAGSLGHSIVLNLDSALELMAKGVRRADVFMGLGLNAASHDPPISHVLDSDQLHTIIFVNPSISDEERRHIVAEFEKWITSNGLREVLETFSVFLLEVYKFLYLILDFTNSLPPRQMPPVKFERRGVSEQVDEIAALITVKLKDREMLASLTKARNCFAHRLGVVGLQDVNNLSGTFTLEWRAFQIELAFSDGTIVAEPAIYGASFSEDSVVQMRRILRSKTTELGRQIMIERRELKEICLCVFQIAQGVLAEVVSFAEVRGISRRS